MLDPVVTITKDTKVTVGVMLLILAAVVTGVVRMTQWTSNVDTTLSSLQTGQAQLLLLQSGNISKEEIETYHETLRMLNPDIVLPPSAGAKEGN